MNEKPTPSPREMLERERSRLLEEAAAKAAEAEAAAAKAAAVERDMADLDRITTKYNLLVTAGAPSTPAEPPASLSIKNLAEWYRTDDRSPYHKVRPASRKQYDKMIKQIIKRCGADRVADLDAPRLQEFYDEYAKVGKIAMGHGFITQLRGLVRFGMNELKSADCEKLAFILHGMHFQNVAPRKGKTLSPEQTAAIITKSHELGMHSIALAQAFQFYCRLTQKDVIGEFVPISDSIYSEIIRRKEKWAWGLRWNEIDEDWVLKHAPSAGGAEIQIPLKDYPEVMNEITGEIKRIGRRPQSGPIIVKDDTRQPYSVNTFRWSWRKAANAAGIPETVSNRDSRPAMQRPKWEPESRTGVKK